MNTGPLTNSNLPSWGLHTFTPMTSLGNMSGVNCILLKARPRALATSLARVVFPSPGGSLKSMCPLAITAARMSSSVCLGAT